METENEPVEPTESPTTITLPDPEAANDNDGGDDKEPANDNATPEQRASRKERRADRYREAREAANEANRRLQQAETERQRMAEQLAELRGRTDAIMRHQTQAQPNPVEREISDLETKAQRHLANAAGAKDSATAQAEMAEYNKALRRAAVLEARGEMQAEMQRERANAPDPEQAGMKVALAAEYPWLATNQKARDLADAYIGQLMSRDNRPYNLATIREACALAAKDFGLGGDVGRPSDARRAAYNGVSARTGAGDDGKTQVQFAAGEGDKLRKLAAYRYPTLDAEDAWKKWLKDHGPGLARK